MLNVVPIAGSRAEIRGGGGGGGGGIMNHDSLMIMI